MKLKISTFIGILILFLLPTLVSANKVIVLDLNISRTDSAHLLDYYLDEGRESMSLQEKKTNYSVVLESSNGEEVYRKYLDLSFQAYALLDNYPGSKKGGMDPIRLDNKRIILKIPFFPRAENLYLYNLKKLTLQEELIFCNQNQICEPSKGENYLSCEKDCSSGTTDGYCDGVLDGTCDEDCVNQGRKEKDIDCTCGNKVCNERENAKVCPEDCKIGFWEWIIELISGLI